MKEEIKKIFLLPQRGMTLLEIMVVIAIIGIVASAIGFSVVGYLGKAKIDSCKAQLRTIGNALDIYSAEKGYPDSVEILLSKEAYSPIKKKQLKDPWGEDIIYRYPSQGEGREYDLCSKGPDKREGTDDDVCLE